MARKGASGAVPGAGCSLPRARRAPPSTPRPGAPPVTTPTPGAGEGARGVVRRVAGRVNSLLSRAPAAVQLGADSLIVEVPGEGEVWRAGQEHLVRWHLTGPVDPVDIHLVQREGASTTTRAVLATGLPAHGTSVRVTVPAGTPAGDYLLLVTSQGLLDAYSRPFHVTAA
nr:GPI anchored serine-threonine rich family protein [Streptomyces sp. YIM 132580]